MSKKTAATKSEKVESKPKDKVEPKKTETKSKPAAKPVAKPAAKPKSEPKAKIDLYKTALEFQQTFDLRDDEGNVLIPAEGTPDETIKEYILAAAEQIIPEDVLSDNMKKALEFLGFNLKEHLDGIKGERSKTEGSSQKKEKKAKKEKDTKDLNEHGYKKGSPNDLFIQAITKKPMTMGDIKKLEWANVEGHRPMTFYSLFKTLAAQGIATIDKDKKMSIKKK